MKAIAIGLILTHFAFGLDVSEDCLYGIDAPDECCRDATNDVELRNAKDCATFYRCSNKKPTLQHCPDGSHWSVGAHRCDSPAAARCETARTAPDECLYGERGAETCCEDVPWWIDVLLRNPQDCGTYYQCVYGRPMLRPCPSGLHWSVRANRCEWPDLAECKDNAATTTQTPGPTFIPVTNATDVTTANNTTDEPIDVTTKQSTIFPTNPTEEPTEQPTTNVTEEPISTTEQSTTNTEQPTNYTSETATTNTDYTSEAPTTDTEQSSNYTEATNNTEKSTDYTSEVTEQTDVSTTNTEQTSNYTEATTNTEQSTEYTSEVTEQTDVSTNTEQTSNYTEATTNTEQSTDNTSEQTDVSTTNTEQTSNYTEATTNTEQSTDYTSEQTDVSNNTEQTDISTTNTEQTSNYTEPTTNTEQSTETPTTNTEQSTDYTSEVTDISTNTQESSDFTDQSTRSDQATTQTNDTTEQPTTPALTTTLCPPLEPHLPSNDCLTGKIPPSTCCRDKEDWLNVLLPNGDNCDSYYKCVRGNAIEIPCPAGLHWCVATGRCEWPIDANCTVKQSTIEPENNTTLIITTPDSIDNVSTSITDIVPPDNTTYGDPTTQPNATSSPTDNTTAPEKNTSRTPAADTTPDYDSDECKLGNIDADNCCQGVPFYKDVLLRNPDDCNSYFQCVNEKAFLRYCEEELHFSVYTDRCEEPYAARCDIGLNGFNPSAHKTA